MYHEYEIPERFRSAARDGFRAVEFLNPYAFSPSTIKGWLDENRLELILINTRTGLEKDKTVGLAALPGREEDFKKIFEESLSYAKALNVPMVHVLAGVVRGLESEDVKNTFISNIRWAAELAKPESINIMLEPLNTQDVSGYFYTSCEVVAALIDEIGQSNIKLQYDFYHMQIMEGNLAKQLERYHSAIGHVQFSSVPGRHEPQYGEVNVDYLFNHLDQLGYRGWIGCEYSAKNGTREGLRWGHQYKLGI